MKDLILYLSESIPAMLSALDALIAAAWAALLNFLLNMFLLLLAVGIVGGVIFFVVRCEQEKAKDEAKQREEE